MKKAIAIILCLVFILVMTIPAAAISSVPVKSVSLDSNKIILNVGDKTSLKVTLTPANTTQTKLTYATSNKNVASVNSAGEIIGVHDGEAIISVFTVNKSVFAKCNVLVKTSREYAGTSVVFSCLDTANFRFIEKHLPEFTKKTGIKASIEYIPESAYMTKLQVVLSSGTGEFDGMYANNKMYPALFSSGWIMDLKDYINDPKKTKLDWDYKDIIPKLSASLIDNGKILGVPFGVESGMLYYNKKMFKDAGITTPPKTMDDVVRYAKLLNKPDKGQAGFATVGTREGNVNGYTWIMIWKTLGGAWRPAGKDPYTVLNDTPAINATKMWVDLLKNYGPQGISNYGWNELFLAFQQEKAAMIMATTKDYPVLTDPTKSKVAASDIGYACIEGQGDEYTVSNISAWMISKTSKHPDAAWQMLQFMTSKDFMLNQAAKKESVQQTRTSVLESNIFAASVTPEWSVAAKQAYAHGIVEYTPLVPQSNQIREYLSIGLSKALSGQATPEAAMKEANDNVVKLMAEAAKAAK